MYICKYCNSIRISNKSLIAHEATCPKNANGYRNVPWNKGKTKYTHPSLKAQSEKMIGLKRPELSGKNHYFYGKIICSHHTNKTKRKLSVIAKRRKLGGYIRGSGRGKKGWYKGFFCDSSWELAFVIYYLEHNLFIKRNIKKRKYKFNGNWKNYIPDFETNEGLVEIKGYKTDEWLAKLKANSDIKVLYNKEMTPILEYVIKKYGKKYIRLYE